ncbi:acylneuraminate cytidylyltransferase family protein [Candidatus Kaiserbacteria bacterium]|nr:acylneuraminate cytidylyltransferase family protein [Candidatus Kaiserbacteria bacterium]
MKILGLVVARGGSKRLPGKNIKDFLGKPLITWSIQTGIAGGVFDRFVLSTDSPAIAKMAEQAGIEVPFMEPAELASDTARIFDVIVYAVQKLKEIDGYVPDWIILLEPSSPGRQSFHIKEVAQLLKERNNFDSLVGISKVPGHFSHLKQLARDEQGVVTRVGDGAILRNLIHRNQDVPESYFINSAIYAFRYSNLFDGNNSLWGNSTYGYEMDNKYAMDIDTQEDWLVAEVKMKMLQIGQQNLTNG